VFILLTEAEKAIQAEELRQRKLFRHYERVLNVSNICWDSGIFALMGFTEKARLYYAFYNGANYVLSVPYYSWIL
jgi:hypothetical protein